MTGLAANPAEDIHSAPVRRRDRAPHLIGLGCAVPPLLHTQQQIAEELASLWRLGRAERARWQRIVDGTKIGQRHGVLPMDRIMHLSTTARMQQYELHAPALAAHAARDALHSAGIQASAVTDLIVVSCTGFAAPGLDAALVEELELSPTVRRSVIGFMGCFGAITGLRAAAGACCADTRGVALLVCCELCSLHLRPNLTMHDQIAAAIFGDGAAAAIVAGTKSPVINCSTAPSAKSIAQLTLGHARILPEGRDWMTWRITDAGFAMTLEKSVPIALRRALADFLRETPDPAPRTLAVHPGGPGILEAVENALGLSRISGMATSWDVLRHFGNMSSATVLFVTNHLLKSTRAKLPLMLLAFGPGLTIESISLIPHGPNSREPFSSLPRR